MIYYQDGSTGFTSPTWQGYTTSPWVFTYTINGDSVTITDCDTSIFGHLTVPAVIEGKSVTTFGDNAFRDCQSLANMTLPDGLTSIGYAAFYGCASLTSITIPSEVTSISGNPFHGCDGLSSIDAEVGNPNYISVDGVLYNAAQTKLIAYPGGKVGYYTFPASVIDMESYAFRGSVGLAGVHMPQWLSDPKFYGCTNLTAIDVEAGHPLFSSLDGVVFNTNLTELIRYPEGKSGPYAVPDGVTSIGNLSFIYCNALPNITFSSSVTNIDAFAFRWNTSLTNLTIPAGITLHPEALLECKALLNINIDPTHPDYTSLGGVLFTKDLSELTAWPAGRSGSYTVPAGTLSIGTDAFSESGLTYVSLPSSLTKITNWAFSQCHSLTNITIPPSVTSIGDEVFDRCSSLTNISIPSSITSIGRAMFGQCTSLTNISIPSSITNIGNFAFIGCEQLRNVTFHGDAPTTFGFSVFDRTAEDFTIHYLSSNTGFTSPTWQGYPATSWFMDNGLDPISTNLEQDVNGDGVLLLTAYALNLDPALDLSDSLPKAVLAPDTMNMTYHAASPGITYTVETSEDLETWTDTGITFSDLDGNNEVTASIDTTAPHRFLRLRVEK